MMQGRDSCVLVWSLECGVWSLELDSADSLRRDAILGVRGEPIMGVDDLIRQHQRMLTPSPEGEGHQFKETGDQGRRYARKRPYGYVRTHL